MIAGGLKVAVVRTVFLSAIYRDFSVLSISSTTRRGESMASALAINSRLSEPVRRGFLLASAFGSNDCRRGSMLPRACSLPRANQEGRILGKTRGVVENLIPAKRL